MSGKNTFCIEAFVVCFLIFPLKGLLVLRNHGQVASSLVLLHFQSLSRVRPFRTPWNTERQDSLSVTTHGSALKSIRLWFFHLLVLSLVLFSFFHFSKSSTLRTFWTYLYIPEVSSGIRKYILSNLKKMKNSSDSFALPQKHFLNVFMIPPSYYPCYWSWPSADGDYIISTYPQNSEIEACVWFPPLNSSYSKPPNKKWFKNSNRLDIEICIVFLLNFTLVLKILLKWMNALKELT